jgi:tetraprenyl-beta-curcumene synthase
VPVWRSERAALAVTFTGAAARYWLNIHPYVRRELRHWRERARAIPDPALRELALTTQLQERGNLEGAAAYAVLAPRSQCARVVRALVAFQAIYDYADTLAEQPSADPVGNGRELHRALASALAPGAGHTDYYAHSLLEDDGGYLKELVEACGDAFGALPAHASLAAPAQAAVARIVAFQALAHGDEADEGHEGHEGDGDDEGDEGHEGGEGDEDAHGDEGHGGHERDDSGQADAWRAFSRWAAGQIPRETELKWWETAAGAASSLVVLALIAAAAEPSVRDRDGTAIERAYFPWIGALHLLLDSLIDRADDARAGRHSLVEHYASPRELADRLRAISVQALRAVQALPNSAEHELILAAMASFYLSQPAASTPAGALAKAEILATLGARATLTMWLFRIRKGRRGRRGGSL